MCVNRSWIVISRLAGNEFGVASGSQHQHLRILELRKVLGHRIVHAQPTVVNQDHDGDAGHRLAHRRNAEECVGSHPLASFDVLKALCPEVTELSVASEQGHRSSNLFALDRLLEQNIDLLYRRGREPGFLWRYVRRGLAVGSGGKARAGREPVASVS